MQESEKSNKKKKKPDEGQSKIDDMFKYDEVYNIKPIHKDNSKTVD